MRALTCKLLCAALPLIAATTHAGNPPANDDGTTALAGIQSAIDDSLTRHAEHLAAGEAPRDLLAAALILPRVGLVDPEARQTAESRAAEWLAKARREAVDDTLFDWIERIDCTAGMPDCDGMAALRRLTELQPSNSWVWLELLAEATASRQDDVAWLALQRAAEAPRADSPYLDYVRVLRAALGKWPLPDLTDNQREILGQQYDLGRAIDSDELRASLTLSRLLSLQWPKMHAAVASLCLPGKLPADADTKRKHCLAVASLLARDGSTQSAHLAGLELRIRIAPDPADRAEWAEELRRSAWELEQLNSLQEHMASDPKQLEEYLDAYVEEGEVAAIRRLLKGQQAAPPPEGWLPESPLFRSLILEGKTPVE